LPTVWHSLQMEPSWQWDRKTAYYDCGAFLLKFPNSLLITIIIRQTIIEIDSNFIDSDSPNTLYSHTSQIGGVVMKTISILLALINSLFAGLLLTYTLSSSQIYITGTLWFLIKSVAAISVIVVGILTWLIGVRAANTGLLLIGSLYLVVLGAVTLVWTYHIAVLSGDMEYYMILFGGSLMTQGVASLVGFGVESRSMTTS